MENLWILITNKGYVLYASDNRSQVEKFQLDTEYLTKIVDLSKFPKFINKGLYLPELYDIAE